MTKLETIPFITLPNWVKAAAHCGFNIESVFAELGITTDLLNVETATIERPQLERVMALCVARARRHHFPFVLGDCFAFDYLPDLETFLTTSPTLREASRVFDWVRELINPMLQVTLHEQDDTAKLVLHLGTGGGPAPKPWFAEATFASILRFGRMLLGDEAPYQLLRFRHAAPPHAAAYGAFFGIPVRFGEDEYALEFARALLDRPLPGGFAALHEQAQQRIDRRVRILAGQQRLVATIEQAFIRRPALFGQGIAAMAEELGLHPRTLQRRLRQEDERFATLQARLRHQQALRYLTDSALGIDAISERLGYSDRRSFTRAFSRWAGMTPSVYRSRGPGTPV